MQRISLWRKFANLIDRSILCFPDDPKFKRANRVLAGADGRELLRIVLDAATGVLRVGDLVGELKEKGLKGYLADTADGDQLARIRAVSAGDVYYFVEGWFARHKKIRKTFSPSVFAKSLSELQKELGTDDPLYNLGRTSASATPLVLAVEAFASYARLFRSHVLSTRDWQFVMEMLDKMSLYYDDEEARQHVVTSSLRQYLASSCLRFRKRDDIRVEAEIGGECVLVAIIEVKTENGFNGDPAVESVMNYAEYCLNKRANYHWAYQLSCCPVLAVEVAGPLIRVGGFARFTDKPAHEPFTPFLHMLKFLQDRDHLEVLARALASIPASISSLVGFYRALSSQVPQGQRLSTRLATVEYPFRILSLGAAEVRRFSRLEADNAILRLMGQQLVFHVRLASGEQRVIKFCQRYGSDVHRLWAESGYAPSFRQEALDGGWFLIDMEYLSSDDGWMLLTDLDPDFDANRHRSQPADWEMCKKTAKDEVVHAMHPQTVHGDLREQNIFYNVVTSKVAFIDFDWAGTHGLHRYPLWLSPHITWPPEVRSAGVMFAEHDKQLLDTELA